LLNKEILPDKCQKPMDIGPCKASVIFFSLHKRFFRINIDRGYWLFYKKKVKRFFYNQTSQQCQQFTFGGCKGNENNFVTSEQCNTHCTNAHLLQSKTHITIYNDGIDQPTGSRAIILFFKLGLRFIWAK
jgi:hypothetical protein